MDKTNGEVIDATSFAMEGMEHDGEAGATAPFILGFDERSGIRKREDEGPGPRMSWCAVLRWPTHLEPVHVLR